VTDLRTPRLSALLLTALVSLACGRGAPAPAAGGAAGPTGAAGIGAPRPAALAYVNTAAGLRREPSDAPRVKNPSGKEVANVLATLQRGEKVSLLEVREEWAKVRSSDDREGWMRPAALLEGDGIVEATVLAPADVFDRPDLLAANARRQIAPGTLVLVVKARPPFSEVNVSGAQNAWVLTERLATGEQEVSVAKLAEKARFLARAGRHDEALQVLAVARTHFAGIPLLDLIAAELGAGPAAVPASGELPPAAAAAPAATQ
jgi:SH3-like domain-containing protein